jgi:hypothetical protein
MNTKRKIINYADIVAYSDNYIIIRGNNKVPYNEILEVKNAPHSISKLARKYLVSNGIWLVTN